MALPTNRPASEIAVGAQLADISAATSAWTIAPCKGRLKRAFSVLRGQISAADCTWAVYVAGVAATGTVTVAQSGSAAGDVDSVEYTTDVRVNEGDSIEFRSAGESSTTAIADFVAVIQVA